jgi:hypothetical protein
MVKKRQKLIKIGVFSLTCAIYVSYLGIETTIGVKMHYVIKLVKSNGGCFFWTEDPRWANNICGKQNMGATQYDNFGDACQVLGLLPQWHQDEFKTFTVQRVMVVA